MLIDGIQQVLTSERTRRMEEDGNSLVIKWLVDLTAYASVSITERHEALGGEVHMAAQEVLSEELR